MENPFIAAMIKFAVLGTAGEIAAKLIGRKKIKLLQTLYSVLVWAVLGIIIKFIFAGYHAMVDGLIEIGYLPAGMLSQAFFKSLFMNAMFGPWLIVMHRVFDRIPFGKPYVPQEGLKGAMLSLLWFWLPAHTVTFLMSPDWQITLAAIWSFVLGLILGFFNLRKKI